MSAFEWIRSKCKFHHTATARGYISRVRYAETPKIEAYKGRFGIGFKLIFPRYDTTSYVDVAYWII